MLVLNGAGRRLMLSAQNLQIGTVGSGRIDGPMSEIVGLANRGVRGEKGAA